MYHSRTTCPRLIRFRLREASVLCSGDRRVSALRIRGAAVPRHRVKVGQRLAPTMARHQARSWRGTGTLRARHSGLARRTLPRLTSRSTSVIPGKPAIECGTPMNARHHNTPAQRLRAWWLSPARHGMQRLINPWEYRHLRVFGVTRIAGGLVATRRGHRVPLVRRPRMGSLLPACRRAESRGRVLAHHDCSLRIWPKLSQAVWFDQQLKRAAAFDQSRSRRVSVAGSCGA